MKMVNKSYHVYAMVTIVFWSLAYVLTKLTLKFFTPFSLGFLRYITATVALLIFLVCMSIKNKKVEKISLKDVPMFLLSGAVGFFLYMIAFNMGQKTVSSCTGSLIIATVPIITAIMARMFYGEKLSRVKLVAIFVEFVGVGIITVFGGEITFGQGLFWLFLAAILLSAYNIIQRKLSKKYSSLICSAYSIFSGTLMLCIFAPMAVNEVVKAPAVQLVYIVALGVLSSAAAYVCWTKAFSLAEQTSQVSNYMFLTPFLASLFGFALNGEIPTINTVCGGVLILLGAIIFNLGKKKSKVLE